MTSLAACHGRPDLAEVRGMNLPQLLAAEKRCAGCPFSGCRPEPGFMCRGKVVIATERSGLPTKIRTITVAEYALRRGFLPKRRRRPAPTVAGQLFLFRVRQPRARKQVAA